MKTHVVFEDKECKHPKLKLGWTNHHRAFCTVPGCYKVLEQNPACKHDIAFKAVNASGRIGCEICTKAAMPTYAEVLAERIHFQTDLSWADLAALRDAMRIVSQLPSLTRDIREVASRFITELNEAELDSSL